MSERDDAVRQLVSKKLGTEAFDVLDVVEIPAGGDRMVRIRTLEEALDDFDEGAAQSEAFSYLVQVRPRVRDKSVPVIAQAAAPDASTSDDDRIFSRLVDETFAQSHTRSERREARSEPTPPVAPAAARGARTILEGVYLSNGKLNVTMLLENARYLFEAKEYGSARNIYRAILQTGERSAVALYLIGRCDESEGKITEAISSFEESIAFNATIEAYQRLAALLIRSRKDQEAAEVIERGLHMKDVPAAIRFELHQAAANCWTRCEQPRHSEPHYRKALELQPDSDGTLANLGACELSVGSVVEAAKHFQEALALNPRNDRALAGLGSCQLAEGDKRKAHDHFARALDVNLNNPSAIFHLVKCAYEIKSYATAARLVTDYLRVAPVNTNLMYSLAGLQFMLGRVDEAKSTASQILSLSPGHSGAQELISQIDRI